MWQKLSLDNILFLDIETVPEKKEFSELSVTQKELFDLKTRYQRKEDQTPEEFYHRAGIWAEFGKIICISAGYFNLSSEGRQFRVHSYQGNEKELLLEFSTLLKKHFNRPRQLLCAHNGKEFDFPYLSRRFIINGLDLPAKLNLFGKKPWEVPHLDTMELWKFGDYKHYTSLKLLTEVLGIPSPKDDIDGSQVREVYYEVQDMKRIRRYCERDVIAVAQILLRFRNETQLSKDEIHYSS